MNEWTNGFIGVYRTGPATTFYFYVYFIFFLLVWRRSNQETQQQYFLFNGRILHRNSIPMQCTTAENKTQNLIPKTIVSSGNPYLENGIWPDIVQPSSLLPPPSLFICIEDLPSPPPLFLLSPSSLNVQAYYSPHFPPPSTSRNLAALPCLLPSPPLPPRQVVAEELATSLVNRREE